MVIFHAGVKEKPCVYSNIPSTYEEDAQSSVGSQKEDFVPQFKISTWFRTPLFYQVVICQKVFRNGISEICRRELCPICFFKVLFVPDSGNLFILQINLYTWFSSEIFSRDLQVSVQYWECNRQYVFWLKLQSLFKLNKSIQLTPKRGNFLVLPYLLLLPSGFGNLHFNFHDPLLQKAKRTT